MTASFPSSRNVGTNARTVKLLRIFRKFHVYSIETELPRFRNRLAGDQRASAAYRPRRQRRRSVEAKAPQALRATRRGGEMWGGGVPSPLGVSLGRRLSPPQKLFLILYVFFFISVLVSLSLCIWSVILCIFLYVSCLSSVLFYCNFYGPCVWNKRWWWW